MKNSPPTWLSDLRLIAWDLDGTLYPPSDRLSEYIYSEWLKTGAEKLGLPLVEAEKELQKQYKEIGSHTQVLDAVGADGQEFFLSLWKKIALQDFVTADPQLPGLFEKLQQRDDRGLALLTNANDTQSIQKKLSVLQLSPDVFDWVFTPAVSGFSKPRPEAFAQLWEKTGIDRSQIVYIGDREETDIAPAHALGLRTIRIVWDKKPETVADAVVDSPAQVLRWLVQEK